MSWLGDMERKDPAYPGTTEDPSTSAWSKSQVRRLREMLSEPPPEKVDTGDDKA